MSTIAKDWPASHSDREFVFAYRDGEWITVTAKRTLSQSNSSEVRRAILRAPTR